MGNFCDAPHVQVNYSAILYKECFYKDIKLSVLQGDICETSVDCIINPIFQSTNKGISYQISSNAGELVKKEVENSIRINNKPGFAFETESGELDFNYIIHVMSPKWGNSDNEENDIKLCIYNCMELANSLKILSINFPLLSTGNINFPKEICINLMISSIFKFIQDNQSKLSVKMIGFISSDNSTVRLFKESLENIMKVKINDEGQKIKRYEDFTIFSLKKINDNNLNEILNEEREGIKEPLFINK